MASDKYRILQFIVGREYIFLLAVKEWNLAAENVSKPLFSGFESGPVTLPSPVEVQPLSIEKGQPYVFKKHLNIPQAVGEQYTLKVLALATCSKGIYLPFACAGTLVLASLYHNSARFFHPTRAR
jgi:hypothetical protein